MTRRRAAVVGGGFGGLVAAGLLARAGLEVTLWEAGATLGGKAQRLRAEGLVLDTGPTLLTMPDVVRDVFAALGASDLLPPITPLRLHCEYRFADGGRFRAWDRLDDTAAEAAAIEPADGDGLRAFYAEAATLWRVAGEPYLEAPFGGVADFFRRVARRGPGAIVRGMRMGTLAGLAARHLRAPALRQFAGRFATYVGAAPDEVSAAFAMIPHLELAQGVHHVGGGMGALVDALGAALRRLGVRVVCDVRAGWGGTAGALRAGPAGHEEPADVVVVNADPLGPEPRGRLAMSGYVLCLGLPRRLALPHHTVAFAADYAGEFRALAAGEVAADPTVYVCHPVATDAAMAAPGRDGLYVMANAPPLPAGPVPEAWPQAAAVRARCLARLAREWGADLLDGATVLAERTPVDFARQGAPRGSLYGYLPRGRFGAFRRPPMRGPVPGVFFAGGGTHPGGGVPLVMRSGRFAAGLALAHLGVAA
ncbi:MAG: phytoene desaturase [bacterium]|nr:phytoene desaturase [bacterium]